jgi:hypothetical protein
LPDGDIGGSIKDDEEIVAMLRVLLSEGRIVHGTVEGEGKRKSRIEKPGPTGLIVTSSSHRPRRQ